MNNEQVAEIVHAVANRFRTFGGGKMTQGNPISMALVDEAPSFAAGVDVEEVVRFIVEGVEK